MRKFTKDHNDIEWLFPTIKEIDLSVTSEDIFDEFEEIGENLLEIGYGGQKTFTRDDMIDAFMKGSSVSRQFLGNDVCRYIREVEDFKKHEEFLKKLKKEVSLTEEENKIIDNIMKEVEPVVDSVNITLSRKQLDLIRKSLTTISEMLEDEERDFAWELINKLDEL